MSAGRLAEHSSTGKRKGRSPETKDQSPSIGNCLGSKELIRQSSFGGTAKTLDQKRRNHYSDPDFRRMQYEK